MDKYTDHSVKTELVRLSDYIDLKCIVAVLAVELGMLLLATYKGQGKAYLPIVFLLMLFTVVGCLIANRVKADKKLLVIVIVLLNLGFLVQQIQSGNEANVSSAFWKLSVALGTTALVAFLYSKMATLLRYDKVIFLLMAIQILISSLMFFMGKSIGGGGQQSAIISAYGITPFELVKIIHVFVAAGLVCSSESEIKLFKLKINRSLLLVVYTLCLGAVFVLCSELGTLFVIGITCMLVLYVFGPEKKWIKYLEIAFVSGIIFVWFICAKVLFPLSINHKIHLPNVLLKMIQRMGTVFHPELYMNGFGYQGSHGLMAISVGGWVGIGTERYRVNLPEANNDFIFSNIIETCGVLMGFVVIIFFIAFLKRCLTIAQQCEEDYYKGIIAGIAIVIVGEAAIHIAYNLALFPIMGIPMYFLSQGFTAIVTSMCMVAILLSVSVSNAKNGGSSFD